ncbi:c-type cytochrome domain-containing protein [Verrucomicrobiota bacterium sgz303538]
MKPNLRTTLSTAAAAVVFLATAHGQGPGSPGGRRKEHAQIDPSKLPPPSTQQGVTYAKDIRSLFEASCFRCHGEERQKGDLRLDSVEAILKGGENGKVIVPGDSAKSVLVASISGLDEEHAMPPKRRPGGPGGGRGPGGPGGAPQPPGGPGAFGPGGGGGGGRGPGGPPAKPLTSEQVGLVRAWIDQGAK